MKEIDDTPVPESESVAITTLFLRLAALEKRVANLANRERRVTHELTLRIANLEARKPPQDTNPDPEWYA